MSDEEMMKMHSKLLMSQNNNIKTTPGHDYSDESEDENMSIKLIKEENKYEQTKQDDMSKGHISFKKEEEINFKKNVDKEIPSIIDGLQQHYTPKDRDEPINNDNSYL
jgi:hypothetical protein